MHVTSLIHSQGYELIFNGLTMLTPSRLKVTIGNVQGVKGPVTNEKCCVTVFGKSVHHVCGGGRIFVELGKGCRTFNQILVM